MSLILKQNVSDVCQAFWIPKHEAKTQKEFENYFDAPITLLHNPEFQKELQEVDLLKDIKDPKQLSETKKKISKMKNYPLFNIDSLGIFLAVPSTTLEKLCKLNKYYEMIKSLSSSALNFKTFQGFAEKLYTKRREKAH